MGLGGVPGSKRWRTHNFVSMPFALLVPMALLLIQAQTASPFGVMDDDDGDGAFGDGGGRGGFRGGRVMELGGPPPLHAGIGGGLEFGIGGILNALLNDNRPRPVQHFSPMRFRMGGMRPSAIVGDIGDDPFEAGRLAARRQSPLGRLFGFPPAQRQRGPLRKVYPFPQDCEAEIVGKCNAIVRVCEGGVGQCTLECETDHPPQVSEKCKQAHPCAVEVERLCPIMSSRHTIFKCLLDHARRPGSNISAACRSSEPCLVNVTAPNCDLHGVGTHVFKRSKDPRDAGGAAGETHPSNPACSCKKKFLGFSGCGAHMSHPFCLPCGHNCVRNPACGSGASWCEVVDTDKCPEAKAFGDVLDATEGLAVIAKKAFPAHLRESHAGFRTCKLETELGMGSFMKDLFGDMEESLHDAVEKVQEEKMEDEKGPKRKKKRQKNSSEEEDNDMNEDNNKRASALSGSVRKIDKDIAAEKAKLEAEKAALAKEQKAEKIREATLAAQLQEPKSALNMLDEVKFKEWEEKKKSTESSDWTTLSKWFGVVLVGGVIGIVFAIIVALRRANK